VQLWRQLAWYWGVLSLVLVIMAAFASWYGPIVLGGRLDVPLPGYSVRVVPVFVGGVVGILFAGSGMVLVGVAAGRTPRSVGFLVELRSKLLLFLGFAAFVVLVAVISTSALRRALIAFDPETWTRKFPTSNLLLYGAFFSVLIALLFVPAYLALQAAGRSLVEEVVPLPDATPSGRPSASDPGSTPANGGFPSHTWFERRSDLSDLLGLNTSVVGALGAAFAVLTPVAASGLAAFLSSPSSPSPRSGDSHQD
jgi:hypothetical protein